LNATKFDKRFDQTLSKQERDLGQLFATHYRVAALLFTARKERGLSQAQLAKMAKVRQSDISRYELGDKSPSLETLFRLNAALGIQLSARILPRPIPGKALKSVANFSLAPWPFNGICYWSTWLSNG